MCLHSSQAPSLVRSTQVCYPQALEHVDFSHPLSFVSVLSVWSLCVSIRSWGHHHANLNWLCHRDSRQPGGIQRYISGCCGRQCHCFDRLVRDRRDPSTLRLVDVPQKSPSRGPPIANCVMIDQVRQARLYININEHRSLSKFHRADPGGAGHFVEVHRSARCYW